MVTFLVAALGVAIGTGLLMPLVIRQLDKRDVWDDPGHRSSHSRPTLRGGGLAMVLPLLSCWLLLGGLSPVRMAASALVLAAFAGLGFADDLRGLGVRPRLLAQLALGTVLVGATTSSVVLLALGPLLVAAVVNAFNFMDGINGISGITLVCSGSIYGIQAMYLEADALLAISAAAVGAGLGFLPFNVRTAQVFLGDVGSYLGGATLAMCAVLALDASANVIAAGAPIAIYGADTLTTLLRRVLRGDNWAEAHREHTYQQLVDRVDSHLFTSLIVGVATVSAGGAGLLALDGSIVRATVATVLASGGVVAYLALPRIWGAK